MLRDAKQGWSAVVGLVQAMQTAIQAARKCWVKRLLFGLVVHNSMISQFLTFSEGRCTR